MDRKVLAECAIKGMEAGKLEIRPDLERLAPQFMLKQMTRMSRTKPREFDGDLGVIPQPEYPFSRRIKQ